MRDAKVEAGVMVIVAPLFVIEDIAYVQPKGGTVLLASIVTPIPVQANPT